MHEVTQESKQLYPPTTQERDISDWVSPESNKPKLDWDTPFPLHIELSSPGHTAYCEALAKSKLSYGVFFYYAVDHLIAKLLEQFDDTQYIKWMSYITNEDGTIDHERARINPLITLPESTLTPSSSNMKYISCIFPDDAPNDYDFRQLFPDAFKGCCSVSTLSYKNLVEISSTAVNLYSEYVLSDGYIYY